MVAMPPPPPPLQMSLSPREVQARNFIYTFPPPHVSEDTFRAARALVEGACNFLFGACLLIKNMSVVFPGCGQKRVFHQPRTFPLRQ